VTGALLQLLPRRRDAPAFLALLAAYWLAAVAGLQWTVIPGAGTAVWPASGIAFAALILGGPRLWPAVFLGRFLAAVAVASPQPWWAEAWVALATALGALAPALLIRRSGDFDNRLGNLADVARLVLIGGIGGALVSGLLATVGLLASGTPVVRIPQTLAAWCLSFAVGVAVFAPVILAWSDRRAGALSPLMWPHLAACLACTAIVADLIFLEAPGGALRSWHLFPVLVWAALAFSVRGVALALVIVSGFVIASGVLGVGPLSDIPNNPAGRLLFGQQFLAVISVTMLVLASAADERRGSAKIARLEALRRAILDAALDCIVTTSDDDKIVEWNGASERVFGYSRAQAIGRDLAELIIPPHYIEAHRHGMKRYLATGEGPVLGKRLELEAMRADGAVFPVELAISAIQVDGRPHFTAYLRDLTQQTEARAAALESEQRLRATYEHAFAGIAEVSPEGRFLRVNERFCDLTGYARSELLARSVWDISHADDNGPERDLFQRHMAGEIEVYTVEKRYIHKDGHVVWVELSASRVVDGAGRPLYGIRVVHDVSQRKRWEQQQRLLVNELNHRVKNTLATVQSIVAQTTRSGGSAADVRRGVDGRLVALSEAHDVLTQENWEGADLLEIVERAAAPFTGTGEQRFRISGPPVRVTPRQALALSMALHELATNAAKYGALTTDQGRVDVLWSLAAGRQETLEIEWLEQGGPPVTPPDTRGFGSRLLQRGLAQDLEGTVQLEFEPTGVRCRISAPLGSPGPTPGGPLELTRTQ
jgi:PAS domain S-box-containing protein